MPTAKRKVFARKKHQSASQKPKKKTPRVTGKKVVKKLFKKAVVRKKQKANAKTPKLAGLSLAESIIARLNAYAAKTRRRSLLK
jgi:hypothetical protein